MSGAQPGPRNSNWRGGRTVTSHGYVLVKDPDNPMAHETGYVYEHRLVASQVLGRELSADEVVHHVDGNKQHNMPANLVVEPSSAHHHAEHRKRSDLRHPDAPNPRIDCACGCGQQFDQYDAGNRPRRYISGHNSGEQEKPTQTTILAVLANGPLRTAEIRARVGRSKQAVATALSKLSRRGSIEQVAHGIWKSRQNSAMEGGEAYVW